VKKASECLLSKLHSAGLSEHQTTTGYLWKTVRLHVWFKLLRVESSVLQPSCVILSAAVGALWKQ
jgi:hypothetical protein